MKNKSLSLRGRYFTNMLIVVFAGALSPCIAHAELVLDQQISAPRQPGKIGSATHLLQAREPSQLLRADTAFSLAELSDLALRNSPATREAWAAANAQAAAVGIAEAKYWPSVDANLALTRGRTSVNSSSGVVAGSAQTRLSPSIGLSYVLYDFGARGSALDAARYESLAANLNQNRALQDVVLNVEQAYYQLLAAQQTIIAGEETLKSVQMSVDVVNSRRHAGLATIGNVYQIDTLLAQTKLQLRQAQGAASKLKGVLCNAVGLPIASDLKLAPLDSPVPTRRVRQAVAQYLEQAKASRPDLSAAEARSRAARASAEAASAAGLPSLELSVNAGRTFNNFQLGASNTGSTSGTIGLNLRVPIFSGFGTRNTVHQAQARAEQLESTRDRIVRQVELDVWQAYFDLDTAEAAIESAHALLHSASQSREVAQARYQEGVGNLPDLLLAQSSEANARMEVIQAEMGWYSSLSRLNNAIGSFASQ